MSHAPLLHGLHVVSHLAYLLYVQGVADSHCSLFAAGPRLCGPGGVPDIYRGAEGYSAASPGSATAAAERCRASRLSGFRLQGVIATFRNVSPAQEESARHGIVSGLVPLPLIQALSLCSLESWRGGTVDCVGAVRPEGGRGPGGSPRFWGPIRLPTGWRRH